MNNYKWNEATTNTSEIADNYKTICFIFHCTGTIYYKNLTKYLLT